MKQTKIRAISAKRKKQLLRENKLKQLLYKKQEGLCAKCHKPLELDYFGWDKHEIIPRARGGDPLDPENTMVIHRLCHIEEGGEKVVNSKPEWSKGGKWEVFNGN